MGTVVTIDGPSGAGKTAVASLVAKELKLPYLPSGTLYRAAAWAMAQRRMDLKDERAVSSFIQTLDLETTNDGRVHFKGQDISELVQDAETGFAAATIAHYPEVRDQLTFLQREFGRENGCVIEGRSTAIEIFPDAAVKIWLTADLDERLKRKKQVAATLQARDAIDKKRLLAPMQIADGAYEIDSTYKSVNEVVQEIVAYCKTKLPG